MKEDLPSGILPEDALVASLRQYIRLNEAIPAFFRDIDHRPGVHAAPLLALHLAILQGDVNAAIFSHDDCTTYLLYLIENKRIPIWQGLSAYMHCLAFMEFTEKQPLKPQDADLKTKTHFEQQRLVTAGKLSALGKHYCKKTRLAFAKLNITLETEEFHEYVLALPPIDQWVNVVSVNVLGESEEEKAKVNFYRGVLANVPFAMMHKIWPGVSSACVTYLMPSLGLYRYFLSKAGHQSLATKFILGTVGLPTLYALHNEGAHPVNLYHKLVSSNIKFVHKVRSGVYLAAVHDLAHAFWGSLFTQLERQFLFEKVLEFVEGLLTQAREMKEADTIARLEKISAKVYDFDLTSLACFRDPNKRLSTYIQACFGKTTNCIVGVYPVGDYKAYRINSLSWDSVFYLVSCRYHEGNDPHGIAKVLRFRALRMNRLFRDNNIIALIDSIAKKKVGVAEPSSLVLFNAATAVGRLPIDYEAIKDLLDQDLDSKTLWEAMCEYHHSDFLVLLKELKLAYFEPYAPLTSADRVKLKAHVGQYLVPEQTSKVRAFCQAVF